MTYADIEIINGEDVLLARRLIIGEDEIKRMTLNILVDRFFFACNKWKYTSSTTTSVFRTSRMQLANGQAGDYKIVSDAKIQFKNRTVVGSAEVLPGDAAPLLGVIPLEEMDVLIDPNRQELIVNPEHP